MGRAVHTHIDSHSNECFSMCLDYAALLIFSLVFLGFCLSLTPVVSKVWPLVQSEAPLNFIKLYWSTAFDLITCYLCLLSYESWAIVTQTKIFLFWPFPKEKKFQKIYAPDFIIWEQVLTKVCLTICKTPKSGCQSNGMKILNHKLDAWCQEQWAN